jgi:energy-converting hydrogenase Eha subunit A
MIQRIQSVYLLLVTGVLIAGMCMPLGYFLSENGLETYTFKPLGITMGDSLYSTWGLFALMLLCSGIAFATIFLFKKRMLQLRMTVFNSILLVGYYLSVVAFYLALKDRPEIQSFHISWALCLPAIAIVLNYLAIRAIGSDEVMVKATDRLR